MLRIPNFHSTQYTTPADSETAPPQSFDSMRAIAHEYGPRIVEVVEKEFELADLDVSKSLRPELAKQIVSRCDEIQSFYSGVNMAWILSLSATGNTKDFQAVVPANFDKNRLTPDFRECIDSAFSKKLDSASNGNRRCIDRGEAQEILKDLLNSQGGGHRPYLPVDRRV